MDSQIVLMSIVSFVLFLVTLVVLFRVTSEEETLSVLLRSFLVVAATNAFFSYQNWGMTGAIGATTIFILIAVLFIFGVFGVIEASITLRILAEIARGGGKEGISRAALNRRYNCDVILKRRVTRFVATGELEEKGGKYYKTTRFSYFRLREYFLMWLRRIFPSLS